MLQWVTLGYRRSRIYRFEVVVEGDTMVTEGLKGCTRGYRLGYKWVRGGYGG